MANGYGSNLSQFSTMPDWVLQQYFGYDFPNATPTPPPSQPFAPSGGGLAPSNLFNPSYGYGYPSSGPWATGSPFNLYPTGVLAPPGGYPGSVTAGTLGNPPSNIGPVVQTSGGPPIIWNNRFALPTGGAQTPTPRTAGGGGALPPPPMPGAPPPPGPIPGVNLSPQDRFRMGQDVDPRSGILYDPFGQANVGNYNPYGPGGPPGTRGIVSPGSPTGGGFAAGPGGGPVSSGPGFPTLGVAMPAAAGGGGVLPNAWQLALTHGIWHGKHPYSYDTWLANRSWQRYQGRAPGTPAPTGIAGSYQGYLDLWNSLRSAGTTSPYGSTTPLSRFAIERSGMGPGGAGRPMTKSY